MSFHLKPDAVIGFAKHVYGVGDEIGRLDVHGVLGSGSRGCAGTALAGGLDQHAATQHEHLQQLTRDLDALAQHLVAAVDAFVRLDDVGPTSTTDHDA